MLVNVENFTIQTVYLNKGRSLCTNVLKNVGSLSFGRTNIDLYTDMKNVRGLVFGFEKFHCCHYFPNDPRINAKFSFSNS